MKRQCYKTMILIVIYCLSSSAIAGSSPHVTDKRANMTSEAVSPEEAPSDEDSGQLMAKLAVTSTEHIKKMLTFAPK